MTPVPRTLERMIGLLLGIGVWISLIVIGYTCAYAVNEWHVLVAEELLQNLISIRYPPDWEAYWHDSTVWVMAGLLLLIALPVFRVILSISYFLKKGDRIYSALTAVVLLLLTLSFIMGAAAK